MLPPSERLRLAVKDGNVAVVTRLLTRFPHLWLNTDSEGKSNLHHALYNGKYLVCFHLISHKPGDFSNNSIDLLTFELESVLHMPIALHHSQTLHYLLQEFPGNLWLNHKGGSELQTPLHYCCRYGFVYGMQLLLEFGASYWDVDTNGNTCLHLCFAHGQLRCIQILMEHIMGHKGIEAFEMLENSRNKKGWLASEFAISTDFSHSYSKIKNVVASRLVSVPQYPEASFPLSSPIVLDLSPFMSSASNSKTNSNTSLPSTAIPRGRPHAQSLSINTSPTSPVIRKARSSSTIPQLPEWSPTVSSISFRRARPQ